MALIDRLGRTSITGLLPSDKKRADGEVVPDTDAKWDGDADADIDLRFETAGAASFCFADASA